MIERQEGGQSIEGENKRRGLTKAKNGTGEQSTTQREVENPEEVLMRETTGQPTASDRFRQHIQTFSEI